MRLDRVRQSRVIGAADSEFAGSHTDERIVVANGLKLFDLIESLAREGGADFRRILRIGAVRSLHKAIFEQLSESAGRLRSVPIVIDGASFTPPSAEAVPELLEDMNNYLVDAWVGSTPIHLSAYSMWRLLYVHPFVDGNGTVARAFSYVVLSAKLGRVPPGAVTIPEQILADRRPYYAALAEADRHYAEGRINLASLEEYLSTLLERQTLS